MRNRKLEKALDLMKQKDLASLVIFSGGTCSILRPSYLYYFSEFRPMGPRNAAVVSSAGDVQLLVEPASDATRARAKTWIEKVRGTSSFARDLVSILQKLAPMGPVGVVGGVEMTRETYLALERENNLVPADDIIEEIAREKTAKELNVVRKAAEIADGGFNAFLESARVGIREYELAAQVEYAMRSAGAEDIFILLSSGKHNFEMHEPRDRRIQDGDVIIGEITPVLEGQFFQLCRTVVAGEPPPLVPEKYDILLRALEETLRQVKAGAPASVISRVMNGVISRAGYAEYCYPPHMRARGHGFGVGSIAPGGAIDDNTGALLEKDQVVVIHPNQYLPEVGYLACGETYLITNEGPEKLSKTETRLYIKEGQ
ncbi:MAG: aminopeptidase P family protein [Deltaproteobacteria bacterium]|nr:aminopeptidase P family protein [Deltaproteobacteria bacterium]